MVKYFGKQLEDFRRDMAYQQNVVLSDLMSQSSIPDVMAKHTDSFKEPAKRAIPKPNATTPNPYRQRSRILGKNENLQQSDSQL